MGNRRQIGQIDVKAIGKSVPAICIILGVMLILLGLQLEGWVLIIIGVSLQALYLYLRFQR